MASRKSFLSKPTNYIFPSSTTAQENHFNLKSSSEDMLEFDEAELWNNNNNNYEVNNNTKKALSPYATSSSSRSNLKRGPKKKIDNNTKAQQHACSSLPINIPDWSKILKDEYKEHRKFESDVEEEEDDEEDFDHGRIRVPPHEYLARTRGASFSVHEGIGRTLKGRDLRSVRNAVWKKVGFED